MQPPPPGYPPIPSYARPQPNSGDDTAGIIGTILGLLLLRRARRRAGGRFIGCLIWLVIILGIVICSIVARLGSMTSYTHSYYNNPSAVTPTSPVQKATAPINATITYAGITMTILDAQQAATFTDDSNSESPGLLRLDFKEQAGPINGVYFSYTRNFQLVASDGTTISASAAQHDSQPDQSVSRTNWIDFPISKNMQMDQYVLRIGAATEAQMDVPLTDKADLAKYQPRKSAPNAQVTYGGVNFTITNATATLSSNGPQANRGMMYVVVNLSVNNNSPHTYYGSLTDIRLKSGATTSPPLQTIDSVETGQTNAQRTLTFVMPQGSTNFTLIFLPSTSNEAPTQATADFQIP